MKISELTLLENNPRQITKENLERLKRDLKDDPDFLNKRPVLVNKVGGKHIVYAGNMRVTAAKELGWEDIPVDVEEGLDEATMRKRVLRDNQEYGEWDMDKLANEWDDCLKDLDLPELDFEKIVGFEPDEKDDEVPETPEEPKSKLGDIYQLGEHRVMCGDSTKIEDVEKLMEGKKADMVFTDPPYGVSYQSNMRTKTERFDVLKNDENILTDWVAPVSLNSRGWVFVWTTWKVIDSWLPLMKQVGAVTNMVVWHKGGGGIGDLKRTFSTDYEVALVCNRGADLKGKRIGSVWKLQKDFAGDYKHPTQKPVELAVEAIDKTTEKDNAVLDVFLGSGSTLIACEKTNRKCYGMELDPKYIDVIIKRWEDYTGGEAVKLN